MLFLFPRFQNPMNQRGPESFIGAEKYAPPCTRACVYVGRSACVDLFSFIHLVHVSERERERVCVCVREREIEMVFVQEIMGDS